MSIFIIHCRRYYDENCSNQQTAHYHCAHDLYAVRHPGSSCICARSSPPGQSSQQQQYGSLLYLSSREPQQEIRLLALLHGSQDDPQQWQSTSHRSLLPLSQKISQQKDQLQEILPAAQDDSQQRQKTFSTSLKSDCEHQQPVSEKRLAVSLR